MKTEQGTLTEKIYEDLFREYRKGFEFLAYSFLGDKEEARDVVSQCFAKLWEKRDTVISGDVINYMYTTVKNACIDYRRSHRNKQISENLLKKERDVMEYYTATIEKTDLSGLFVEEILDICRKTLQDLPEEHREAFLKNRVEGLTYQEIAQAMGISYSRVNKDIFQTLSKLRLSLKDYLGIVVCIILLEQIQ